MALTALPARNRVSVDCEMYRNQGRRCHVKNSNRQLPAAMLSRIPHTRTAKRAIKWTPEEDAALVEAVRKYGEVWTLVAAEVPTHTGAPGQCNLRWNMTLRPDLVRGKWSPEEDVELMDVLAEVDDDDVVDWCLVASKVKGRNAKQCRERFLRKLNRFDAKLEARRVDGRGERAANRQH